MKAWGSFGLILAASGVFASDYPITLAWDASPDSGVGAYRLHYGQSSGGYSTVTNAGLSLSLTVNLPSPGVWFFACTAVGTNQMESDFSNEVSAVRPVLPPTIPGGVPWVRVVVADAVQVSTNLQTWEAFPITFLAPATNSGQFWRGRNLRIEGLNMLPGFPGVIHD